MKRALWLVVAAVVGFSLVGGPTADAARNDWRYVPSDELGFDGINTAKDDSDPFDPENDVISVDTDPAAVGPGPTFVVGAFTTRFGSDGIRIAALDDDLKIKYLFIDRTCGGGAPRFQLAIDEDGDGSADGQAHGYIGNGAHNGGCPQNQWVYEDMTNTQPKWDLQALGHGGSGGTLTWQEVETALDGSRVLSATVADDSASFADTAGCAYYDDVVADGKVFRNHSHTVGTGADGSGLNNC